MHVHTVFNYIQARYMYICVHNKCVHTRVCTISVCMMCVCACVCACMYMCVYMCMCVCIVCIMCMFITCTQAVCVCVCVCVCACTHVHAFMHGSRGITFIQASYMYMSCVQSSTPRPPSRATRQQSHVLYSNHTPRYMFVQALICIANCFFGYQSSSRSRSSRLSSSSKGRVCG